MIVNANLLLRPNVDWSKIPQYDQADLSEKSKFRPDYYTCSMKGQPIAFGQPYFE